MGLIRREAKGVKASGFADSRAIAPGAGEPAAGRPTLLPLTPEFDPEQHQEYVDRLTAALDNRAIRNVALTGRYGGGKSSVLQKFTELHSDRMLSLSLSTLGPGEDDESATNQIEKELVKQLLHSRPPRELPQSRYRRIESLSIRRAAVGSAVQLAMIGGLLWLLGLFPHLAGLSGGHAWLVQAGVLLLFAALALTALTWIRLAVHNRVVSSVSAAGASISLTDKEASYFDKYLDEIVYYFESVPVDVVIFEDLDRFNDPHIFEALRELNALLNASRPIHGKTIRFVYALKDSVFEQLGHDTRQLGDDAAFAESVRANRTKFFDLVIPIVPFITHRSSRDLLTQLLADDSLIPVTSEVVDLTARHITDMRLLKNIRNEYAVFATRLITRKQGVPQLRADSVFAMMVYKNIHLADFEQVQLGRSDLDDLYKLSRDVVRQSIARRRNRLRRIADSVALADALGEKAGNYGERLSWYMEAIRRSTSIQGQLANYTIGSETFEASDVVTETFWRALLTDGQGVNAFFTGTYQSPARTVTIGSDDIRELFQDQLQPADWDKRERQAIEGEHDKLVADIELLRRADFTDLAARPDFALTRGEAHLSFEDLLKETVGSEVARDLVRQGFIDQNFTLYVAQYYGDRVSVPAMNFIVQHVQTNTPDAYYSFPAPDDVASILRETKSAFLDQDSAYNIAILDYLLASGDAVESGVGIILGRIARIDGPTERAFLDAYLSDGVQTPEAVRRLATIWPAIFLRLIETVDLTPDRRLELVNAGLTHTAPGVTYDLGEPVEAYLQRHYTELRCLTQPTDVPLALNAVATLARAGVLIDDLAVLDPDVRTLVIARDMYTLTAPNLRTALDDPDTLSLDTVRAIDPSVYEDCNANPQSYLDAVAADEATNLTVADPTTFVAIVTEMAGWGTDLAAVACGSAAAECQITDLAQVPPEVWPALARSRRFAATLSNVSLYVDQAQGVDDDLGALLVHAGAIEVTVKLVDSEETDEESQRKVHVAEAILNGSTAISAPEARVRLVSSLGLSEWINPDAVEPEEGHLLGQLLEHRICDDTVELFRRFDTGDWETLRYGIERSAKFADFVTPDLLKESMTARLLSNATIDTGLKRSVLGRLDEFVPTDHRDALLAAGQFAAASKISLDAERLKRIAHATGEGALVMRLIDQRGDMIGPDQIVAVLTSLGGPYGGLATPSAEFSLPKDSYHLSVLNRLKQAGLLAKVGPRRTRPEINIVVA